MAAREYSPTACALPEDLRRYYLDTMGIQLWQSVEGQPDDDGAVLPEDSGQAWEELEQAVASCTRCGLHASRTQTVFGVGSHSAQLLVIGEAPGRDEDLQGEPFVGRAGQLLNAMLAAIGLRREQVYIANILKCRPPNNRDPGPEEAGACNQWLQSQIELLQPSASIAPG